MKSVFLIAFIILGFFSYQKILGVEVIKDDNDFLLFATPEKNKIATGDTIGINLTVVNLSNASKTLLIPKNQDSGFDCLGGYYTFRDSSFWRSAELRIAKVTTNPRTIELLPGESFEFEIKVKLFDRELRRRQFCVFSVILTQVGSENTSLVSNRIVIWHEPK